MADAEDVTGGTDAGPEAEMTTVVRLRPRGARAVRISLAAGLAAVVVAVVVALSPDRLRPLAPPTVAPEDQEQMAAAERLIDSLDAAAYVLERDPSRHTELTDAALIALSYHERMRLGAGSPFRLAGYAMRDPRLTGGLGRATAWSILAKTARGRSHQVDPGALVGASARAGTELGVGGRVVPATRQLALIDSAVAAARGARTGEETVRLALALARAERLVDGRSASVGVQVAALARDRRLAVLDARRLLDAARRSPDDALTLLERWREERRFAVEQPLLADALRPDAELAAAAAPRLLAAFREAAAGAPADSVARVQLAVASRAFVQRSFLPSVVARRLAASPGIGAMPTQAPVEVTMGGARRRFVAAEQRRAADDGIGRAAAESRRRFVERTRNEETLAAEHAVARAALLRLGAAPLPPAPVVAVAADVAEMTLAAVVSLRTYSQETVWLPGMPGPSDEELRSRFGLRRVAFDAAIPAAWRPYYRQQIASALGELQGVLPSVRFDGLAVRVGESVKRDSALALHDPATRTVYLPAGTGAGTIAHELAHDLDWQTARSWLALRGAYSTDRAARDGRDGVGVPAASLARSVRGLTAARPRSAGAAPRTPERPAELFARGVDWLAAATLARAGRMNGVLTSVQDEALPGYAGVVPPEPGDRAADALVEVLDDMTVLPLATRDWYLARFGEPGAPGPAAVARAVLAAGAGHGSERGIRALGLSAALALPDHPPAVSRRAGDGLRACRLAGDEPWRAELLWVAAESRARGLLRERALRWPPGSATGRWAWEAQATVGGPWSPAVGEDAVRRVRDALLRQAAREDEARGPAARTGLAALVFGGCG